jgi:hypothetical protein
MQQQEPTVALTPGAGVGLHRLDEPEASAARDCTQGTPPHAAVLLDEHEVALTQDEALEELAIRRAQIPLAREIDREVAIDSAYTPKSLSTTPSSTVLTTISTLRPSLDRRRL